LFFPATVTYFMSFILEVTQHNITSCLLDISVPCSRTAEEPLTASGTNPQDPNQQSHCLYHKTPLLLSYPLRSDLRQIHLAGNKLRQRNMSIPSKDLLLFWRTRLTKTSRRPNEERK
jgi:hypothetical protein